MCRFEPCNKSNFEAMWTPNIWKIVYIFLHRSKSHQSINVSNKKKFMETIYREWYDLSLNLKQLSFLWRIIVYIWRKLQLFTFSLFLLPFFWQFMQHLVIFGNIFLNIPNIPQASTLYKPTGLTTTTGQKISLTVN